MATVYTTIDAPEGSTPMPMVKKANNIASLGDVRMKCCVYVPSLGRRGFTQVLCTCDNALMPVDICVFC